MHFVIAILLLCCAAWLTGPAGAEQRWCSISNEGAGNCSFASIGQCRETMSGTGGNCIPEAPVGHLQPRTAAGPAPKDEKLDALLDRVNKKNDKLILCRGC
jgi:hypothetical protein